MRQVVSYLLVTGFIVLMGGGCRGRQHRPYDADPFSGPTQARANRSPVVTESLLSPSDSQDPEVTHAGGEYSPRATERDPVIRGGSSRIPQHDQLDPLDLEEIRTKRAAIASRPRSGTALDNAPDYSWIQGRLEYSALGGGVWKVRYAPISADDEHGGSVILASEPDSGQFQSGDTVYVEGRIVPNGQRRSLQNPIYQVQRMRIVEE